MIASVGKHMNMCVKIIKKKNATFAPTVLINEHQVRVHLWYIRFVMTIFKILFSHPKCRVLFEIG